MHSATVKRIIRAYDDPIVRAYCWARFGILRQRFLDEIGQYLPEVGPRARHRLRLRTVLALLRGHRAAALRAGLDVSGGRIALARRAAGRLGLDNVSYEEGDARDFKGDGEVAAAYMLDIVHHMPRAAVPPLLAQLRARPCRPAGDCSSRTWTRIPPQALVHLRAGPRDGAAARPSTTGAPTS